MQFHVDALFILTLITAILTQRYQSYLFAMLCGLNYIWTGIFGHNYIHRRDNYRMMYSNLLFMNYRDWRIGHVLSHHMYPNSLLDCDLLLWRPLFAWTRNNNSKNSFRNYACSVYTPFLYFFIFPLDLARR